jgi:hypothetical protein
VTSTFLVCCPIRACILYHDGILIAENDDWSAASNADEVIGVMRRTGAFGLAAPGRDADLLVTLQPGSYTAQVDSSGGQGVALAEIYDASTSPSAEYQRLVNISTRGFVGSGDDTLIGGFIVTGNAPKRVLVRGVGPTLAQFGVTGALANPRLKILQGNTVLVENDNWGAGANTPAEVNAAATATSAFALDANSKDATLLITLAPGVYTAHVSSADASTGIALVEVYEMPAN